MNKSQIYNVIKEAIKDNNIFKLQDLLNKLEEDIKTEVIKSKGGKTSDLSIIKYMYKNSTRKDINGYNDFIFNDKTFYGFLDGYHAVCSIYSYEQKKSISLFNFNNIFNNKCFKGEQVKIDLTDLKTFLKLNPVKKDVNPVPYIVNTLNFDIGFNPKYLLNVLAFCNTDTIIIGKNNLQPAYCKNDTFDKIGLVLPIRPTFSVKSN